MSALAKLLTKGGNLARQGDIAGARAIFERAAREFSNSAEPWINLSAVHGMTGHFPEALRCARKAVELAPTSLQGWINLANAAQSCGDARQTAEALQRARGLPGCPPDVALQLGSLYLEAGRLQDAWHICEQAIAAKPNDANTLLFQAALLRHSGRAAEARRLYERVNGLRPNNPQILQALCQTCWEMSDPDAGIAYAQAVLRVDPRNLVTLLSLGSTMIYRDSAEARRLLDRAVALAPNDPAVLTLKAELLEFSGDKLGAWECVQTAIQRGYTETRAFNIAASVASVVGKTDEAIAQLEQLLRKPGLSATESSSLHFTLAGLCDKTRQYDRAFEHAIAANRLKNAHHDDSTLDRQIRQLMAVYSAADMAALPRSGNSSDLPIFIVGMPRSGTSLLEQILSCHSKVYARGETDDIPRIAGAIPHYPEGARSIAPERLDALAAAHIARIRETAPDATRITDKLPGNFLMLGLINQMFPKARIINCRRDPRDLCLSNFMTDFGGGHGYSYNLEALARVCKSYQELMDHWKQVLPLPILDMSYEELVDAPQTQIERLLEFCGLEWEEACLNFHASERQVMTASYDQVRQPLYKKSVARWKNYAQHLASVTRILGLHDDSYP
ncbi:MAG: sulfotransferase [Gammaproteobacteria bacterium]|nr:sulfotransferase [Gammaproteobacteria bacterium]